MHSIQQEENVAYNHCISTIPIYSLLYRLMGTNLNYELIKETPLTRNVLFYFESIIASGFSSVFYDLIISNTVSASRPCDAVLSCLSHRIRYFSSTSERTNQVYNKAVCFYDVQLSSIGGVIGGNINMILGILSSILR